eukprot:13206643-Alexandrium_andersonii.AAC.1
MPTMPSARSEPGGSCIRCTCIDAWSTVHMGARAHSARARQSPGRIAHAARGCAWCMLFQFCDRSLRRRAYWLKHLVSHALSPVS